jgi:hypothetical protein
MIWYYLQLSPYYVEEGRDLSIDFLRRKFLAVSYIGGATNQILIVSYTEAVGQGRIFAEQNVLL